MFKTEHITLQGVELIYPKIDIRTLQFVGLMDPTKLFNLIPDERLSIRIQTHLDSEFLSINREGLGVERGPNNERIWTVSGYDIIKVDLFKTTLEDGTEYELTSDDFIYFMGGIVINENKDVNIVDVLLKGEFAKPTTNLDLYTRFLVETTIANELKGITPLPFSVELDLNNYLDIETAFNKLIQYGNLGEETE